MKTTGEQSLAVPIKELGTPRLASSADISGVQCCNNWYVNQGQFDKQVFPLC